MASGGPWQHRLDVLALPSTLSIGNGLAAKMDIAVLGVPLGVYPEGVPTTWYPAAIADGVTDYEWRRSKATVDIPYYQLRRL